MLRHIPIESPGHLIKQTDSEAWDGAEVSTFSDKLPGDADAGGPGTRL